ncbi:sugar kinase [Streptomyces ipomoeae]|uniref:Kinase, PfkB family n=2 Tax=Streptomyces ipomoeae TaxID=103232 RepID=L1KWU3_9ACTN|nr:sugar kinase [Streptomyces ipomoeae]EKX65271.1 kinase, PfkB family [Streptomyces ipomoeae 91-03]MDX2698599.1 sugar kinase [Streptomyces ipomoeae]MDX2844596.1 sugar kinase [Streptomyces ipomoeae]TQE33294.1 sugar kinase [Streptomyces ipomoeae]
MNAPARQRYLVTVGEALAVLAAPDTGPLTVGSGLRLGLAGAESNVAVGVSRLGGSATWIGRVSDDALGDLILRELRAEGVTTVAVRDPAPTSLLLRERRTATHSRTRYYRTHTAGSRLSTDDIPEELVAGAAVLHITGITPALGEGPSRAVTRAVDIAVDAGVPVSLDINFRSLLWNEADAGRTLLPLLRRSDVVFAGPHEGRLMVPDVDGPEELAKGICDLGPAGAVIKLGAEGAYALLDGREYRQPAVPVTVQDSVGAGDAFAAGYLAELLAGEPPERRLRTAALLGAFAVSTTGDWEGLPRRSELGLLDHHDDIVR